MAKSALVRVRKVLFQVHLWVGLILLVALVPLGLTGSALMFPEWLVRVGQPPAPHVATSDAAALSPSAYLEDARSVLPAGARMQALRLPAQAGDAVAVSASTGREGPGGGRTVWLDPASGAVIAVVGSTSPIFGLAHDLHGSFMAGGLGRALVGWAGVAMLALSLTGLWLWWPRSGSLARAFRWRRTPDTLMNLHHMTGFWISLPLAAVSVTGVLIAFPGLTGAGGPQGDRGERGERAEARGPRAPAAPIQSVDTVVAVARAAHPMGRVVAVTLPGGGGRPGPASTAWRVEFTGNSGAPAVRVDDRTGAIAAGAANGGPPRRPNLIRAMHEGELGPVWRWIVFLSGLAPLALALTGAIYWAKLELRKARLRATPVGEAA